MELFKKKTFWYAFITLLVFCTDIWVYFYLKTTPEAFASTSTSVINESPSSKPASKLNLSTSEKSVTQTPENDLKEIKNRAENLTDRDIQALAQDAVNQHSSQDQRFKSVYLLAHNGKVPLVLKEIIKTPIPENINERDLDFEQILRAQAIEGLENSYEKNFSRQVLSELMQTTDNVFLLDRLHRAKNSLDGISDSSEVQDNKELEKIIEN